MKLHTPLKIALIILASLLSACTTLGPEYIAPETKTLVDQAKLVSNYTNSNKVLNQWWHIFGDANLTQLIDNALENNRDIVSLEANLRAARANLSLTRLDRYPTDRITLSSGESRQSAAALGQQSAFSDTEFYSATFAPQWDLDLFGAIAHQVKSSTANFQAQEAQFRSLQLMVIGDVATQYFELQSLYLEQETLLHNVEIQRETLRIVEAQYNNGRGTQASVFNARSQLYATQASVPTVESRITQVEARLSTLTGRASGSLQTKLASRSDAGFIEQALPIGDLAELIRRQPSIQVAERKLASSVSGIGVAISSLFPTVSLVGSAGYSAEDSGKLFDDNALQFSFGPTLSWSLTNLIRGKQRISAAKASSQAALADYEQSVLRALEDLSAALARQKAARDRQPMLDAALEDSKEAARIIKAQYELGATEFRNVLDSESRLLQRDLEAKRGIYDIISAQISVFRALGAG